ncbi:MAG: tetratricopeptide repeat protein [Acidobacteria bacterium]|nr:tetratricopeptide repeat protein [Acidobacteriota bacterium]
MCLLLVTCTLAVYNGVTHNGFVNYDDDVYVTANRHVQAGLRPSTVSWAFTTYDAANWHPLTWISHALDYQIFKLNPAGHHYVSVLVHCVNVVLLFLLLVDATKRTWPALVLAAIYALHPLNVESVAWIAERKNVLSMMFLLLALWAYQRYALKPGVGRYEGVLFLFACGLMAKPQVITLPFLLLLWDYWPLGRLQSASTTAEAGDYPKRSVGWLALEKIPLLALSAASALVTISAQQAGGAVRSAFEYSPAVRIENAIGAYFDYVGRMLWPMRLAAMYPHPGDSLLAWQIAVATIFVVAVTLFVLRFRQKRYLVVSWLWYMGALVPMIGLVQVGQQATADRYMYLPMIGLLLMLTWGLSDWANNHRLRMVGVGVLAVLAMAALGAVTYRQVAYWHDSEMLWTHAAAVTKNNFVAHINLGETFLNQERTEEAAGHFRAALQIRPNEAAAHLNLGTCERRQKNFQTALQEDQAVLRLTSDKGLRAYALVNMGSDYRLLKDYDRAKESYEAGLQVDPEAARAFVGLGVIAEKRGQFDEAVRDYSRAVGLEPSDVGYLLLAQALEKSGLTTDSRTAFESGRRISPDFERAQEVVRDLLAE